MSKNIFGEKLIPCSNNPLTGFYRDGDCRSGPDDRGMHTVCAVMTDEFLTYSKMMGNDLSTPRPEFSFPGLKAGDHWCLCALRWVQAWHDGKAPWVIPEATNERTLEVIDLHELVRFAWKNNQSEKQEQA